MKKIMLAVCSILIINLCVAQEGPVSQICPPGYCYITTLEIPVFNFHKPRTNCKTGFGLCIKTWIEKKCLPCLESSELTTIENGTAICWAEVKNGKLELHIPAEIKVDLKLTDDEASEFSIERGSISIQVNGKTFLNKQGNYPVVLWENDLVVLIDLE